MCNVLISLQWMINSLIVCNDKCMNRSVIKVWIEMWIEMWIEVRVFVMNTMWWMMKRGVKMWMKRVMWCRDAKGCESRAWDVMMNDEESVMKRTKWREEWRCERVVRRCWGRLVGVTLQRDRILPQIRSSLQ